MKKLSAYVSGIFAFYFLLHTSHLYAQATDVHVFQEWVGNTGLMPQFYKSKSARDNVGNMYVAGSTMNANGDWDWLITKYNGTTNELIWSITRDQNGYHDFIGDIIIDANCNLYVTGVVTSDTAQGTDLAVAMYDSSGTQVWFDSLDNGQTYPYYNDAGTSLAFDDGGSGFIYVAATSQDATDGYDYLTLQYDAATGTRNWETRFDYYGYDDYAANAYTYKDYVYITGMAARTALYDNRVLTLKYDNTGSLVSQTVGATVMDSITEVHDVAADTNGNIYAVGYLYRASTGKNAKIIKMDSTLNILWQFVSSFAGDDEANAVCLDSAGNVYIGGYKTNTTKDYLLARLDTSGVFAWMEEYDGVQGGEDIAYDIAIDNYDQPIITGHSETSLNNMDYYTMKYDSTGALLWEINYNGLANKNDFAYQVATDNANHTYVVGQSQDSSGVNSRFMSIKYVEHELWNVPDEDTIPSNFDVTPNWGQLLNADTIRTVNTTVKYYNAEHGTFFKNNALVHVFVKIDTASVSPIDTLVRVDMMLSSDSTKNVYALDKNDFFSSFYLPHTTATNGLEKVPSYKKIVYPEIYRNIDMMVAANYNGIKEQFIVKQGGYSADIEFVYDGQDSIYIDNGNLIITTILDTIVYLRPNCSQIDSGGNNVPIIWQPVFKLIGDTVTFDSIQSYNTNLPLVIEMNQGNDPLPPRSSNNPVWCTHYGDNGSNDRVAIDSDNAGNLYVTGTATSLTFPTQTSILTNSGGGGAETFMSKFNPYGTPVWSILYGGDGPEMGNCVKYDNTNDVVYFGGWTSYFSNPDPPYGGLQTNFPLYNAAGAYNHAPVSATGTTTYGYIVKFLGGTGTFDGTRQWATLYGEDASNAFTEVISMDVNTSGNLLIGGQTENKGSFPIVSSVTGSCSGTPYSTPLLNTITGYLACFDLTNQIIWSTPFGCDHSSILDVKFDAQNKIYAIGDVPSADAASFPLQHEFVGDYSVGFAGGSFDASISKFNFGCWELKWSTLFGGNGSDRGYTINPLLNTPNSGFIGGSTTSTSGLTIVDNTNTNSINNSSNGGLTDGYVTRFKNNIIIWSTYVGGTGVDEIRDMEIGNNNILYLLGTTESNNYVNINYYNAYNQSGLEQISDATITAIDIDANHTNLWSSYFGGTSSDVYIGDRGVQLTTSNDILYISGVSYSNATFPWNADLGTYPLAYYQPNRVGTAEDIFLAQIDLLQTPIGIEEITEQGGFVIYPNPAIDYAYLRLDETLLLDETMWIDIIDMQGRKVQTNLVHPPKDTPIQINLLSLTNGLYLVKINSSIGSYSKKMMITH